MPTANVIMYFKSRLIKIEQYAHTHRESHFDDFKVVAEVKNSDHGLRLLGLVQDLNLLEGLQ